MATEVRHVLLRVRARDGAEYEIRGDVGSTLMEAIRNGMSESPFATCGGNCMCGTCHVYVAPDFQARLPAPTADENDMLDGSMQRTELSRLSCQLRLTSDLEGLRVEVAPEG